MSHGLWQRAFGGRDDVIGRDVILTGRPHTVIGVLPPDGEYPIGTELWLPLAVTGESRQEMEARGSLWLTIPLATAQERMALVQNAQNAASPDNVPGTGTLVTLVRDDRVATAVRPLWLLQGAVLLVLLIACANVSNLFLARATARERTPRRGQHSAPGGAGFRTSG